MNGESRNLVAPKFTVGTWDRLTAEQQRIFITYVRANFGGDVGADPGAFAARLLNDSVSTANSGSTPASDRLLNLSRVDHICRCHQHVGETEGYRLGDPGEKH